MGNNLHRCIIFADAADKTNRTVPFSLFDGGDPEDLWRYLAGYEEKTGGQALAIPHNGNLSNGLMFADVDLDGNALTRAYAESRMRWEDFGLAKGSYALVTLHRPSNVDYPEALEESIEVLKEVPFPIVFPIHPRTVRRLDEFGLTEALESIPDIRLIPPESYVDFLSLLHGSRLIFSDSGSVQAEASLFNVLCLVCRENTERPIYLEQGTSALVGRDKEKLRAALDDLKRGRLRESSPMVKELGSGVARRIVDTVVAYERQA